MGSSPCRRIHLLGNVNPVVGKGLERLLPVSVTTEVFSVATELLALCRDMVLCVAIWFPGYKRLLGRHKGFTGGDRVVFFWFSITIGVFPVSGQCFVLCHDNVVTKGPLSQ